jgi:hypothetical protein
MKRFNCFIYCLSFIFCLSSCEDLLTVDSARYVNVDDYTLSSPNDSVSSVLGLMRLLQNVSERYILYGEMRADLLTVTEYTPAAVRELSDFAVKDTGEYANPRDYYAIINNCNYFISRTSDAASPLAKENAAAHAIRAWTYMQVVFNWGKAYYFTEPLLSVEDTQKDFPAYTISQVIDALITDLEPFVEVDHPYYGVTLSYLFFPVKVLLGDLYLWRGNSVDDYEKAAEYYAEYISTRYIYSLSTYWLYDNFLAQNFATARPMDEWSQITRPTTNNPELITYIMLSRDASEGKVSQLVSNYTSFAISDVMNALWDDQTYVLHVESGASSANYYTMGDLRKQANTAGFILMDDGSRFPMMDKIYYMDNIMLYRLGLISLRYAEAVNRAGKPHTAFAVLKHGLGPVWWSEEAQIPEAELADNKPYMTILNIDRYLNSEGIHTRGCGHSQYNMFYRIGGIDGEPLLTLSDTIQWVEEAICTELALETSFEGNRFQDLMRMALRRNDPSFLAKRVAAKHENDYDRLYNLLSDTKNWFLPEPK